MKTKNIEWKKIWNSSINKLGKLGEQKHLSALRDGFALLVPLMIASSIGVICMTFVFGHWDTTSTSILGWITWGIPNQVYKSPEGIIKFVDGSVAQQISQAGTFVFYTIWKGIFSFISIFSTLTISYSFARIKNTKEPFIAILISLGSFLILTYGNVSLFDAKGLLLSIISSLITIELYTFFEKKEKLQLKMPAGVPPAVGRSFSKLFPTIFTLLIMVAIQAPFIIIYAVTTGFGANDIFSIGEAISIGIQAPFLELASGKAGSYSIGFIFVVFSALLWFLGLHGNNILAGIFTPIFLERLSKNVEYVSTGVGNPSVIADGTQDAFIYFGGTGTTLALVLVGFIFTKRKMERELLKFGGAPALFNINEPLVFGIPLVLNFTYFIPYIFTQFTLFTTTWLSIEVFKWVPPVIVKIPWTTPIGIGGFLATSSWQGIILSLSNFLIACLIWMPFVLLSNHQAKKKGEELIKIDYHNGFVKFKRFFQKKEKINDKTNINEENNQGEDNEFEE